MTRTDTKVALTALTIATGSLDVSAFLRPGKGCSLAPGDQQSDLRQLGGCQGRRHPRPALRRRPPRPHRAGCGAGQTIALVGVGPGRGAGLGGGGGGVERDRDPADGARHSDRLPRRGDPTQQLQPELRGRPDRTQPGHRPVGANGKVDFYNSAGTVQMIADVSGWFLAGNPAAGAFAAFVAGAPSGS